MWHACVQLELNIELNAVLVAELNDKLQNQLAVSEQVHIGHKLDALQFLRTFSN